MRTDEDLHQERKTTWIELFFDLVFVSVVAVLSHGLSVEPSWEGVGKFVLLFVPVWWVWLGMTIYVDRLEVDDLSHRLLHFLVMLPVAGLAFFAHDALGDTGGHFALAYAAARLIIIAAWLRGGWHNPVIRPLTTRYAQGYLISVVLWSTSVFVPPPGRYVMWAIGLLVDLLTPPVTVPMQRRLPRLSTSHIPERLGLFTIIVLGESVIGVANGVAELEDFSTQAGVTAALGLLLAFGLWWMYFAEIGGHHQKPGSWWGIGWTYFHLPLLMGLVAIGSATLLIVVQAEGVPSESASWLLGGAVATVFLSAGAIAETQAGVNTVGMRRVLAWAVRLTGVAAALLVGASVGAIGTNALMALMVVIVVAYAGYMMYRRPDPMAL